MWRVLRVEQEKLAALEQEYANVNPKLAEIEAEGRKSDAKVKELQVGSAVISTRRLLFTTFGSISIETRKRYSTETIQVARRACPLE